MKAESVEVVDFDEKQFRRHLTEIIRAADKFGFVGIKRDGQRRCYLVSAKFWRPGGFDSESFVKITNRGKPVAYAVPLYFWEMGLGFMVSFALRAPETARDCPRRRVA